MLIVVGLVAIGSALECYVCSAIQDSTCNDHYIMPSSHRTSCGAGECSKLKSKGKTLGGVVVTNVERSCGGLDDGNVNCAHKDRIKAGASEQWKCTCNDILCNSGEKAVLALPLMLLIGKRQPTYANG